MQQRETLFRGGSDRDGVAFAAQSALERPAHRFLVVNDQNVFHRMIS